MAFLTIEGKELEARTDFKFLKTANDRYNHEEKGQKVGGLYSIYMGLMQQDIEYLAAFWDCALSHLIKDKPIREVIEEALEQRIEDGEDPEHIMKEAFRVLEDSGFFRAQIREIWKNVDRMANMGETEKEKKDNKEAVEMMQEKHEQMLA